ncbi:MAG: DUF5798 family protein [Halobacteriales archaeon]
MLGNAGKKLATIVDLAEELYDRTVELREEVAELRETTRETRDRVAAVEDELAGQRAIVEAIAEAEGIDVDAIEAERAAVAGSDADEANPEATGGTAEGR